MYVFPCMKSSIRTVCIKWKGFGKEGNFITKKRSNLQKMKFYYIRTTYMKRNFFLQKKEVTFTENKIRKYNE